MRRVRGRWCSQASTSVSIAAGTAPMAAGVRAVISGGLSTGRSGVPSKPKSWDVGLTCIVCGQPVRRKTGYYAFPVGKPVWARHVKCPRPKEGQ